MFRIHHKRPDDWDPCEVDYNYYETTMDVVMSCAPDDSHNLGLLKLDRKHDDDDD